MIDVNYDIFEMKEFRYAPRYAYNFLTPAHLERLKVISEEMTRFAETAEIMHNSLTPDFNALMSISREIDVSISLGLSPMSAVARTSVALGIPTSLCFFAGQIYRNCQYNYEKYSFYLVVLILEKLGFGPVQTARLMNKVADCFFNERSIKELIFAKDNIKPLEYFKKELDNFISGSNLDNVKNTTKQLLRVK